MIRYFANLSTGKIVLWCYLIWYAVNVGFRFDSSPAIWLNSLGLSLVIGVGLNLSVAGGRARDRWQTFRLFLIPFCVSSFASLIKGQGYLLVVPPDRVEQLTSAAACLAFVIFVQGAKFGVRLSSRV